MTKEPDQATVLSVTKRRRYENIFLWVWSMPLIVQPLSELFFFYVSFDSGVFSFFYIHYTITFLRARASFMLFVVFTVIGLVGDCAYWFGGRKTKYAKMLLWGIFISSLLAIACLAFSIETIHESPSCGNNGCYGKKRNGQFDRWSAFHCSQKDITDTPIQGH